MNNSGFLSGSMTLVIAIVTYAVLCLPLYTLAKKTGHDGVAWLAFVPILSFFLVPLIADKDFIWMILMVIPCVGFVVWIYLWMLISEDVGKPSWLGLLMIIPGVNAIIPWILAFA